MIPGPKSRQLAKRLRFVESRNITYLANHYPVFWESARGSWVMDADRNTFLDLTSAFAVSSLGHTNPPIQKALIAQAKKMWHGMGDVHPNRIKVEFLEALQRFLPGSLSQIILSSSGAEAVESALKTARLATGRPGVLAFEGAYHGLSYGTLAVTDRAESSDPFANQIARFARRAPYPDSLRGPSVEKCLDVAEKILKPRKTGAVLVEAMQGRGGMRIPPEEFLKGLAVLAKKYGALLITDEIMTGFGRTGRWFAFEHAGVRPDLVALGKAMANGFPISACAGTSRVMNAWPPSDGEAIHTSTFLGNPLGCAMGLASLKEMKALALGRSSAELGESWRLELERVLGYHDFVGEVRGRGLFIGVEIVQDGLRPDPKRTGRIVTEALRRGLILLSGGKARNVLSLTPPLTIEPRDLRKATDILAEVFDEVA